MPQITLEHVSKRYGAMHAVRNVSLTVDRGELLALLGPSGCGKTTTLRMIAGFVAPTEGRVVIDGRDVTDLPPYRRSTGMVFQGYALFPHMTVFENVAFGLQMRKVGRAECSRRVAAILDVVRMGELSGRYPRELSGGQQQRTALARALVIQPDVLLLDEPLSNLDAKLRHEVRAEIRRIQKELQLTAVLVTHDQEEALAIADRLVLMSAGTVVQTGTPAELYDQPADTFVANFIGSSNFFHGTASGERFVTDSGYQFALNGQASEGATVLSVRPENIKVIRNTTQDGESLNIVSGTIIDVSYLGSITHLRTALSSGEVFTVSVPSSSNAGSSPGDAVALGWSPADCRAIHNHN